MADYYRILGVSRHADRQEIRRAYWALARRLRDGRSATAGDGRDIQLRAVHQAYETLGNTRRRREYDVLHSRSHDAWPPGAHSGDDLLSDEIAVDFPSMADVVERIRASFFGGQGDEGGSTHTTEVELTARQADQGARVPLDLQLRHTCPVCGGRGEMWTETCAVCGGSGAGLLSHQLQLRVPPGVRHGTLLRFSLTPPYAPETHVEVRIAIQ